MPCQLFNLRCVTCPAGVTVNRRLEPTVATDYEHDSSVTNPCAPSESIVIAKMNASGAVRRPDLGDFRFIIRYYIIDIEYFYPTLRGMLDGH
jgi:hypothetical protein